MPVLRSLLLLVLLLSGWTMAGAAVARLEAPRVEMAGYLAQRLDSSRQLSIEQVADPRQADSFTALSDQLNPGYTTAAAWLRFTVENTAESSTEWWLEVQPAFSDHITLYIPEADGGYGTRHAGSTLPFSAHEIGYRNPVFKLMVPAGGPQTYYLRINTETRTLGRLTFWQPGAFIEAAGREQIAFGLYLGVYLLLVLASVWFELAMRDRVYLYFGLYVFACILSTLTTTGLWQQYIFPNRPECFHIAFGFSLTFLFGMCLQFLFRFLEMERQQPRLTKVYLTALWIFCGIAFVGVVMGYQRVAMHLFFRGLLFVVVPSAVLILFRPALRSPKEIRYAFVATGLFLAFSFACMALVNFHVIRPNLFTENAMYISSMAFFLIVYYAVSWRYRTMRRAKEEAQNEALRISRRSEQELETLVIARTDELVKAVQSVEAALAHAKVVQQEQRHFITTVSHELRTPLAVIDATTQNLVREGLDKSEKGQARLRKVQQATKRLSVLFDDYLSDQRFDEFSQGIKPQHVAVLPLLQDAIDAAQSLADRHLFSIEASGLPQMIWVDPKLFRLALRTLVDNAVKYTPPGTRVALKAQETPDGWCIDVTDTGPGIPADEQKLVFERYYRGRASSHRVGTGLGLPLAQRMIEMHGGTLQLIVPSAGGSCFRICLPYLP